MRRRGRSNDQSNMCPNSPIWTFSYVIKFTVACIPQLESFRTWMCNYIPKTQWQNATCYPLMSKIHIARIGSNPKHFPSLIIPHCKHRI